MKPPDAVLAPVPLEGANATSAVVPRPDPLKRALSGQLARLAARFSDRPVRLGELTDVLQLRGFNAVLLFLAFPFITPVPLPGLSTLFGSVIALLGLRMALARRPWLPARVEARVLPARFLPKVLLASSRILCRIEKLLRPRFFYPEFPALFQQVSGAVIFLCGALLLLPLPVPFSNAFPAVTIILLAAAGLERDGAVFLAGCFAFALCLGFFGALVLGGSEIWQRFGF